MSTRSLAGFHTLSFSAFQLTRAYRERGMSAYSELQQAELDAEAHGYTATRHQREVGTGYFDKVSEVISGGSGSTLALGESTEAQHFETPRDLRAWQAGAPGTSPRDE